MVLALVKTTTPETAEMAAAAAAAMCRIPTLPQAAEQALRAKATLAGRAGVLLLAVVAVLVPPVQIAQATMAAMAVPEPHFTAPHTLAAAAAWGGLLAALVAQEAAVRVWHSAMETALPDRQTRVEAVAALLVAAIPQAQAALASSSSALRRPQPLQPARPL